MCCFARRPSLAPRAAPVPQVRLERTKNGQCDDARHIAFLTSQGTLRLVLIEYVPLARCFSRLYHKKNMRCVASQLPIRLKFLPMSQPFGSKLADEFWCL